VKATERARLVVLEQIPEERFQADVIERAAQLGWWWYHPRDSRRSTPGWVDLTLVRPPRVVLAELKSQRGSVRKAQAHVRALLEACPGVEVYLWRPADWPAIEDVLAR
jgi:hypothetical protein